MRCGDRKNPRYDHRLHGVLLVAQGMLSFSPGGFFEFMKGLYAISIACGRRVVVIPDKAKYHHARWHRPWRQERAG